MPNPTYKTYQFEVTQRGQRVPVDFELDKNVKAVTGLALDASRRGSLFTYGTQRMEIGGVAVFAEGHRSNMLMFGISAANKFHKFSDAILAGNGKLRVDFLDTAKPGGTYATDQWEAYTVFLTIETQVNA